MEPSAASPVDVGAAKGGSDQALQRLRAEIVDLEAELAEIERATVEVTTSPTMQPQVEARRLSEHLATEVGVEAVARERVEMQRFLEAADDVARARVTEARNEADTALAAARDEVARAASERAAAVARALDEAVAPPIEPELSTSVGVGDDVSAGVASDSAPGDATTEGTTAVRSGDVDPDRVATPAGPAGRRRGARVLSALLWIVGSALVVLALAFAIVVVLAVLD